MEDAIVAMLNALSGAAAGGTDDLLKTPGEYNTALYVAAVTIHNTAVKPITAVILSIMFVLMLASTSTRVEGDRELGVRIIAATMFKCVMVLVVARYSASILSAINSVSSTIATTANDVSVGGAADVGSNIGDAMRDDIADAGMVKQLGMLVILLIPFIVAEISGMLATVLVFVRFLQLYMLTAFSSLPLAFFGHEDTKPLAIGYLKRYATTSLQGVMLIIAVKLYQALLGGWLGNHVSYDGETTDMWNFVISNFGNFLIAPAVLIFLLFGANSIAKAIVGEG
ncbi:hypothetical protein GZ998_08910 [Actinomyces sp. 594]|uniref:type IV secretion system protein n=1 Tax=Actinomyces sp. 594 TaxID=2057793 RepID=UPI001C5801F6|nr:type IV secretion system protein [Actinomyces sp. 594]MBW3069619.1 hypothetical protein [Actinomyces sp. 594]